MHACLRGNVLQRKRVISHAAMSLLWMVLSVAPIDAPSLQLLLLLPLKSHTIRRLAAIVSRRRAVCEIGVRREEHQGWDVKARNCLTECKRLHYFCDGEGCLTAVAMLVAFPGSESS
jgi:hypothetical protein